MGSLGKILLVIVVISAVVAFVHSYYPSKNVTAAVVMAPTIKIATTTANISTDPSSDNGTYVELEGTALMDTSEGLPAAPYIQYVSPNHSVVTKQLIFANSRGCSPNAGDLPCVPSYPTDNAYPDLTTGERISVKGYIRADRLLVYEITPV